VRLDGRQSGRGPVALAEGSRAIQGHHRRGVDATEHVVERDDLGPVVRDLSLGVAFDHAPAKF
jgi:hypothetical protein